MTTGTTSNSNNNNNNLSLIVAFGALAPINDEPANVSLLDGESVIVALTVSMVTVDDNDLFETVTDWLVVYSVELTAELTELLLVVVVVVVVVVGIRLLFIANRVNDVGFVDVVVGRPIESTVEGIKYEEKLLKKLLGFKVLSAVFELSGADADAADGGKLDGII